MVVEWEDTWRSVPGFPFSFERVNPVRLFCLMLLLFVHTTGSPYALVKAQESIHQYEKNTTQDREQYSVQDLRSLETDRSQFEYSSYWLALCSDEQQNSTSSRNIPIITAQQQESRSIHTVPVGLFRCYVPVSRYPRVCVCLRANCQGTAQERINCDTCLHHGSTYDSQEACESVGEVTVQEENPADSYPDPTFATTVENTTKQGPSRVGCPQDDGELLSWCDPMTWGGMVPSGQGVITVPLNTRVLLEPCAVQGNPLFTQILIPYGSELVFADADMHLTVSSILVRGKLSIGSPTCRMKSNIRITMPPNLKISDYDRGIIADKGILDIHGADFRPTWTRLGQTAMRGSKEIQLQESVPWLPGQQMFITTSIFKDEVTNQNEVVQIESVSTDGRTIQLVNPLQFQHYGGPEYQSEVGLLSRNILVEGTPQDDATQIGTQILVGHEGRIRGVIAYRAGQVNVKGAYPFHLHMVGDGSTSVFSDNSVYRSFYRCYTVHGTNNARLEYNTAFHALGNCFYLEDGVEERNIFEKNLAAYIHPINGQIAGGFSQTGTTFVGSNELSQPADTAASGFYISNPNNDFIDNAASGGISGFSMVSLEKPIGLSRSTPITPASRPFGQWSGNSAHSSGYFALQTGGCIYFGGSLKEEPMADYTFRLVYNSGRTSFPTASDSVPIVSNTTVWLCNAGLLFWGQKLNIFGFTSYDSIRPLFLLSESIVKDGYSNAKSDNPLSQFPGQRSDFEPQAGFQLYDTGTKTILIDMSFENYKYQPELGFYRPSIIYSMTHSDQFKPEGMANLERFSYINVDYNAIVRLDKKETGSSRMFNFVNMDGTVVNDSTPTIVGAWPDWWEIADSCRYESAWNTWVCPKDPTQEIARIDMRIPGYTKKREEAVPPSPENNIGYISQFGDELKQMTLTINEGITGVTGPTGWYVQLDIGAPKTLQLWITQLPVGLQIVYAMRYPAGSTFTIQRIFKWFPNLNAYIQPASSLSEMLSDGNALKYYFDGAFLYVKLIDPQELANSLVYQSYTVYGYRWWDLYYNIEATSMQTDFAPIAAGGPPPALPPQDSLVSIQAVNIIAPSPYIQRFCTDYPPLPQTCDDLLLQGLCNDQFYVSGAYCALSCGRCSPVEARNSLG